MLIYNLQNTMYFFSEENNTLSWQFVTIKCI